MKKNPKTWKRQAMTACEAASISSVFSNNGAIMDLVIESAPLFSKDSSTSDPSSKLSIKMEEYVQAIEYYKEFVQIAPRDSGRYILQYKLYESVFLHNIPIFTFLSLT